MADNNEMPNMRDIFAMMAMQGILAGGVNGSWEMLARMAYSAADAMLQERAK